MEPMFTLACGVVYEVMLPVLANDELSHFLFAIRSLSFVFNFLCALV